MTLIFSAADSYSWKNNFACVSARCLFQAAESSVSVTGVEKIKAVSPYIPSKNFPNSKESIVSFADNASHTIERPGSWIALH